MKTAIVTDSTSDITPQKAGELGVTVAPLNVRFGSKDFRDRIDIDSATFFKMLCEPGARPATSLPSPGDFVMAYNKALESAGSIVSIHISSRLSGTFQSARTAAMSMDGKDIAVIDSGQVASALMLVVAGAAKRAADGASKDEIVSAAQQDSSIVMSFFIVDTLEYLERGGRIGKAGSMIGGMLNIKPILTLKDGVIESAAKVRSRKKGVQKVIEMVSEKGFSPCVAAVSHAACPDAAEEAVSDVSRAFPGIKILRSEIGPVIGTHTGPGCVEISFL